MPDFILKTKVDQIVTKEVEFIVSAKDEDEAQAFAKDALKVYPEPLIDMPGIKRVLTAQAKYWIPKSIEVTSVKRKPE